MHEHLATTADPTMELVDYNYDYDKKVKEDELTFHSLYKLKELVVVVTTRLRMRIIQTRRKL
jgi:hypothetical protein